MITRLSRIAFYFGLLLVVALSLIPQDSVPAQNLSDKAGHAMAYAALALAGGIGYRGLRSLILVGLGLLLLGAALELAQSVLPDRMASLHDVLANAIGIVLGSLFASGANTVWPKHRPSDG
jgi:VanZ family protein